MAKFLTKEETQKLVEALKTFGLLLHENEEFETPTIDGKIVKMTPQKLFTKILKTVGVPTKSDTEEIKKQLKSLSDTVTKLQKDQSSGGKKS